MVICPNAVHRLIMSVGSASVASWKLWTKASDPARVARANWYAWHALSKVCSKCWAMVRATNRRRKSPTTSPRTAPEGFWRATSLPRLGVCIADAGVLPWATSCDTPPGRHQKLQGHPKRTFAMSAVKLLGPGVVPRRALRRFVVSKAGGSWIGDAGSQVSKSGGTGSYGCWGRAAGSVSWFNVVCGARR